MLLDSVDFALRAFDEKGDTVSARFTATFAANAAKGNERTRVQCATIQELYINGARGLGELKTCDDDKLVTLD